MFTGAILPVDFFEVHEVAFIHQADFFCQFCRKGKAATHQIIRVVLEALLLHGFNTLVFSEQAGLSKDR